MTPLFYLHGEPKATADLRTHNSDFIVQEILPFLPTGEGEHHMLHIRKEGLNTADVAQQLSTFAGVHPKEVTFAGKKDKHALTEQWFGIRIPGKETPDWEALNSEQLTVLSSSRHSKKLRTGALAGNRFTLTLRAVSDIEDVINRIASIKQIGVPNYFGEQRFGHDGKNLIFGRQMLAGKNVKDRNKRSMYLSAVRSHLFNEMVSTRLETHGLTKLNGDCVMLAGSKSYFVANPWDDELNQRLHSKDIQLSAPLWGRGSALAQDEALVFESQVASRFAEDCDGLAQAGLNQERRTLLLEPQHFSYEVEGDTLILKFALPAGCFATSLIRELVNYQDVNEREFKARRAERNQA
ncbi:tRNA pseudouridine(13) synthase TruD [Shewanella colwelliana]|uniref:tRNA pseudouridine synthase D n=1 Tax=Shewanella colwelliana TaxID=23 RepID=A0A1E5IXI2_SHECO|nr:tRNA pseudouridine(13) synthase TruD [Shewanella colwelliana]OEG75219.1 tRNA pseudouridine(13) synthase TruD [Shewanella colwelliana]